MKVKNWVLSVVAVACAMAAPGVVVALDDKPTEAGKGSALKSMVFEIKEKAEVAILLPFTAGREAIVTTNGDKQTDVHLFIYDADNKEVGKDTTPGPTCEVKFTPMKEGTFKLLVKNEGPEPNKVTLNVKAIEQEDKPTEATKTSSKSMVFEINEKSEVAVLLPFMAGKEATVTTNGDRQTDVHLFVHDSDSQEVGKDTTPGPTCEVKFTPMKDGTFKLVIKNEGPGPNKVTLESKVAE